jgi:hypothetical protein
VTKKRQDYRKANVEVKNQDPAEGEKKKQDSNITSMYTDPQ